MKRTLLLAILLAGTALPAQAAIAVFVDGRTLKVSGYELDGRTVELHLASGGRLSMPLDRLERIIDDEVELVDAEIDSLIAADPTRSWGFDEARLPRFGSRFDPLIIAAARRYDVDATLISCVIKAESDFNPAVVSHKGAQGLMQLMPATARRFGVTHPFDPASNIFGGTKYLRWLLDRFDGDVQLALAGYNAGEGNVAKYNGIPPFRETVNYVSKITRYLGEASPGASPSTVAAR